MTRAETIAVITLAGEVASLRLPPEQRGTCHATAIHEAAHCVVALRLGVVPVRVHLGQDGGGAAEFAADAGRSPRLSDGDRARAVALLALPESSVRDRSLWVVEMRRRARGMVNRHWPRILALAAPLATRGHLTREEILAVGASHPSGVKPGTAS